MKILDLERVNWINANLCVTHDKLSKHEALCWERLFRQDSIQFFSSAVYGFVSSRRRERGQMKFTDHELKTFCREFREKIRLAVLGIRGPTSLPLFEISGIDIKPPSEQLRVHGPFISEEASYE